MLNASNNQRTQGGSLLPILYSFRRCPYAIRARMAIAAAGLTVELREVWLRDKPQSMLEVSTKGTVPVLVLPNGQVIDESYDVMIWALRQNDPESWLRSELQDSVDRLVAMNDFEFKTHLDHYKYADRYPEHSREHYRQQAESFLERLDILLEHRPFLLAEECTLADITIFPFIRQFAFVDKAWFDQSRYQRLTDWLNNLLESRLFLDVMPKFAPWKPQDQTIHFPSAST